jgi:hypothetical protein
VLGQLAAVLDVGEQAVVEQEEGELELPDDDVLVVAGIADQGAPVRVPRQVLLVAALGRPDQERVAVVHVRLVVAPAAVDAVEVEDRRAEVRQRVGVVLAGQARDGVEGQVVVDELPEVGYPCRQRLRIVGLRLDHASGQLVEELVLGLVGGQVAEHAPEAAERQRRLRHAVAAAADEPVGSGLVEVRHSCASAAVGRMPEYLRGRAAESKAAQGAMRR